MRSFIDLLITVVVFVFSMTPYNTIMNKKFITILFLFLATTVVVSGCFQRISKSQNTGINKNSQSAITNPEQETKSTKPTIVTPERSFTKYINGVIELTLTPIGTIPLGAQRMEYQFWNKESELYLDRGDNIFKVPNINAMEMKTIYRGNHYFFKDNTGVYVFHFRAPFNKKSIYKIKIEDVATVEVLGERNWPSSGYLIKDNKNTYIYNEHLNSIIVIDTLDAKTLSRIPSACPEETSKIGQCYNNFFFDINGVYNINLDPISVIPGLDPASTKLFNLIYPPEGDYSRNTLTILKDNNIIYKLYSSGELVLYPNLDFETFEALSDEYQKDKDNIFYTGDKILNYKINIINKALVVDGADVETAELLYQCSKHMGFVGNFFQDKNSIYAEGKRIIDNKDNFRILGEISDGGGEGSLSIYTDGKHVYRGCSADMINGLSPNDIEIVANLYIKNRDNVYDRFDKLMEGVKPENCTKEKLSACHPEGMVPF